MPKTHTSGQGAFRDIYLTQCKASQRLAWVTLIAMERAELFHQLEYRGISLMGFLISVYILVDNLGENSFADDR